MSSINGNKRLNVLGVASSMRINSRSTIVLNLALDAINRNDAETRYLDLRLTHLPFIFSDKFDKDSAEVKNIIKMVEWADVFILATPDYHGSMSSSMKNFLEHFVSEFAGKLFSFICSSHEKGLTATDQMRTAVRQCYGWSLPYNISVDEVNDFDSNDKLVNPLMIKRVKMLARDNIVYGTHLRKQFNDDLLNKNIEYTFAAHYRSPH
jgi:FMN reductase